MIRSMTRPGRSLGPIDVALAVLFCGLGVWLMVENVQDPKVDASRLAIPVFLLVTIPVLWRRQAPTVALGATFVALLVHIALFGTITRCGLVFPLLWVLVFAAGAHEDRNMALVGLGLGLASVTVMLAADYSAGFNALPVFGPLTAVVWGTGRLAHSRGRLADQLRARTEELRHARDERARLEVASDRARLSAELDELLQRRLGELAQLADAGAAETDTALAGAALADIEHESRRTLQEMRAVVGALRDDDGVTVSVNPQPTLTNLEALVLRAKGADARLTVSGSPRALPAGVELSAYRVVENLLDALDDAPGVEVDVRFRDDALELAVSGPARRRDAGASMERARERVQLHAGTLRSSARGGRAHALVELPVLAPVAAEAW